MSEAVLLVILTPIAGALATLIIKVWEAISNRRKTHLDEGAAYRNELRVDMERKDKEIESLRAELREARATHKADESESDKWQSWYYDLYAMFYSLRLLVKSNLDELEDQPLAAHAFGIAPHERAALDK